MAGVILCAGGGTRMGKTRSHKVCEPIAGRPAIVRLIDTLRADGVDPIVAVVGHRAGDVVETIGASHPGVLFVYQRDQIGTGHAARVGIEALGRLGYEGNVLITIRQLGSIAVLDLDAGKAVWSFDGRWRKWETS